MTPRQRMLHLARSLSLQSPDEEFKVIADTSVASVTG
jgi:hypothetical protein